MDTMDRRFNRRELFGRAATTAGGAAVLGLGTGCSSKSAEAAPPAGSTVASDQNAVVNTTAGKVRGFTRSGIHTFKGIPYAADTGGGGRFVAPSKPAAWTGVRGAMWYGPTCPQAGRTRWGEGGKDLLFHMGDGHG